MKFKLFVTLPSMILANQQLNCQSNDYCRQKLSDANACCLYFEQGTSRSVNCQPSSYVNFFIKSQTYDKNTKIWTSSTSSEQTAVVYCMVDSIKKNTNFSYPYKQIFFNNSKDVVVSIDFNNTNARSDMFYKPKQVYDFWTQIDKYFGAWVLYFTPIPVIIWWNNLIYYLVDLFSAGNNKELQNIYPSMYNNWFTALFMSDPSVGDYLVAFKYYDLFTFRGYYNWWIDAITTIFA